MRVLGKKICVVEEKAKDREVNGIVIPAGKMDPHRPISSKVVCVGPEVEGVKEGNVVFYMPLSGQELNSEDGKTWRVLHEDEVIAVE